MIGETFEDLALQYKGAYLPALTLAIVLTSFTMMTYGTIVTVAVPNVMGAFGIGQDKAQLMATGFYIAMTTSQLICAWLIFSIGHYYTFFISIIFFALACFLGCFRRGFWCHYPSPRHSRRRRGHIDVTDNDRDRASLSGSAAWFRAYDVHKWRHISDRRRPVTRRNCHRSAELAAHFFDSAAAFVHSIFDWHFRNAEIQKKRKNPI